MRHLFSLLIVLFSIFLTAQTCDVLQCEVLGNRDGEEDLIGVYRCPADRYGGCPSRCGAMECKKVNKFKGCWCEWDGGF